MALTSAAWQIGPMPQIDTLVPFLQYGALGLTAILAFLAFRLMRSEQDRPEPRESILKHIRLYLGFAAAAMVLFVVAELIGEADGTSGFPADSLSTLERELDLVARERESSRRELDDLRRREAQWGASSLASYVELGLYYASYRDGQDMIDRAVIRLTRALREFPDSLAEMGMREEAFKGLLRVREALGPEDRVLLVCGLERRTQRDDEWHLRLARAHYAWGLRENRQAHFERSAYHFLRLVVRDPARFPPGDVASVDAMARQMPRGHFLNQRLGDVVGLFEDVRQHFAEGRGANDLQGLQDRARQLARQWAANLAWADPDDGDRDPAPESDARDC